VSAATGVIAVMRRRQGRGVIVSNGTPWAFHFGELLRLWDRDRLDVGDVVTFRKGLTRDGHRRASGIARLGDAHRVMVE
jgi:hypothetical protein